jgi:hypothetical protein
MKFKLSPKTTLEDLAVWISQSLADEGIEVFLSGGSVVSLYTQNAYLSYDLDFVSFDSRTKIKKVMEGLGFAQDHSRHFVHQDTPFIVEFPGSAMLVGESLINELSELKNQFGVLKLLTPTDCVKDRLAAFYHWNDSQGLDQAVAVANAHPVKIEEIEKWSTSEGMKNKFQVFVSRLT